MNLSDFNSIQEKTYWGTIANFNCTRKINKDTYPMLTFFNDIIWEALNDKSIYRSTKKINTILLI